MNSRYIDPYVVCPYYSCDETTTVNKLHCLGYKNDVFVQMFFKTRESKKTHKKCFCNNKDNYQNCPLCKGNIDYENKQIP